ncbi:hypothetical protein BJF79_42305 [Actinomadura sp. CNU-125]|uniref:hypothetical protein n=1 Tax=Actinomadura sp. CNU-125 TaxID=1904961 RepID=UPI000964CFAE|nr:hypothetical protein [Actinomadura sp. CNU-125]OLT27796.1 hypothetical protein BJF79_42305 [Actinomadura sp. CNU-125]
MSGERTGPVEPERPDFQAPGGEPAADPRPADGTPPYGAPYGTHGTQQAHGAPGAPFGMPFGGGFGPPVQPPRPRRPGRVRRTIGAGRRRARARRGAVPGARRRPSR